MPFRKPITLIINADDYGYFPCISQGIIDAANAGCLTACGIFANSPNLASQLEWLEPVKNLDIGVHLNLTYGQPMSAIMLEKLSPWEGRFPGIALMCQMVVSGKITIQDVRSEWHAQIQACKNKKLQFLNAHEHIHMLPVLFPVALELARDYSIPYVRLTQADWLLPLNGLAIIRNGLMQVMQTINQRRVKTRSPHFLGLSRSGKLDYEYLNRIFSRLQPGESYELMCHPGHFDSHEVLDHKLKSYHDWEGELALLLNPNVHALYEKYHIRLSNFQSLTE